MPNLKILVVDDDPGIRTLYEKFLRLKHFEVLSAESVLEALRIQKREAPDLVITDYNMPEMNGIDLLKELQHISPDLPVIMISGGSDMRTAVESLREHAFDYLPKPVDLEELVRTIHLAMKRKVAVKKTDFSSQNKLVGPVHFSLLQNQSDIAVLSLQRPLDQLSQPAYETALTQLDNEGKLLQKVIVCMGSVTYINNVGLNFLLDTFKKWQSQNRQVAFCELSAPVHRYLKTLGYLDFFRVTSSLTEAAGLFTSPRSSLQDS